MDTVSSGRLSTSTECVRIDFWPPDFELQCLISLQNQRHISRSGYAHPRVYRSRNPTAQKVFKIRLQKQHSIITGQMRLCKSYYLNLKNQRHPSESVQVTLRAPFARAVF